MVRQSIQGLAMLAVIGSRSSGPRQSRASPRSGDFPGLTRVTGALVAILLNVVLLGVSFELLTEARLGFRTLLPGAVLGGVGLWAVQLVGGTYVGARRRRQRASTAASDGLRLLIGSASARPGGAARERGERRVAPSHVAAHVPALGHPASPEG